MLLQTSCTLGLESTKARKPICRWANSIASARPIPPAAPVTTPTLPFIFMVFLCLEKCGCEISSPLHRAEKMTLFENMYLSALIVNTNCAFAQQPARELRRAAGPWFVIEPQLPTFVSPPCALTRTESERYIVQSQRQCAII